MASNPQIRIASSDEEIVDLGVYALENNTTPAEILGDLLRAFLDPSDAERVAEELFFTKRRSGDWAKIYQNEDCIGELSREKAVEIMRPILAAARASGVS